MAKAFVRKVDGKPAIWSGVSGPDAKVLATVGDEQRTFTQEEWDKLPVWDGPMPTGVAQTP